VGTLVVIALWAWMFPELRRTGALKAMNAKVEEEVSEAAEEMR
jgi:hypothetical protein